MIGLRSLNLWVGWYNISDETITYYEDNKAPKTVKLAPGLYSFNMLANFIMIEAPGVDVSASEPTGLVEIIIPKGLRLSLSEGLKNLLGIYDSNPLNPDTYVGDVPIDFMTIKDFNLHINQISTTNNVVDGKPSTLLKSVPLSCEKLGTSIVREWPAPEYKKLQPGQFTQLELSHNINNNNFPISVTLHLI